MAILMHGVDLGEGEEETDKGEDEEMEVELEDNCGGGMEKRKKSERR